MSSELFTREALSHLDALRNFAFKLCRDEHHTKDLVQETMYKACRSSHTYEQGTNCRAWLFQICKNSYINDYRRKRYEAVPADFSEDAGPSGDENRFLSNRMSRCSAGSWETAEMMVGDEVAAALRSLPSTYQTALILSDLEGYTYEEIAEFTKAPIGTIRSRIHRARKILAGQLDSYARNRGYGESLFAPISKAA